MFFSNMVYYLGQESQRRNKIALAILQKLITWAFMEFNIIIHAWKSYLWETAMD